MNVDIISTSDGSPTLYSKDYKDTYHSKHGAIQESLHIFVSTGKTCSCILEMGFGTGLNVLLTCLHAENSIHYTSIELHPLKKRCWQQLDYDLDQNIFRQLHEASWNEEVTITQNFILQKIQSSLEDINLDSYYDCIYFDAFAPSVQPELWTEEIFEKMYACLVPGGVLITYSAKGEVRRYLQKVGLKVERLPGPPGKREYLRAYK